MSTPLLADLAHLRSHRVRANLVIRDRIRRAARSALTEAGFLEVDTPVLGARIDEYAAGHLRAETASGHRLWLAQSPQLYKQALIAAGLERYFQFAHCFRDEHREPGRTDYLREFVQLDVEMRTDSSIEIMAVVEHLLRGVLSTLGIPIPSSPFPRVDAMTAMREYGTDRPDLRSEGEELSCLWVVDFPVARSNHGAVQLERHPMARPQSTSVTKENLTTLRSHSFDLVVNGYEIASGALRIHDPAAQSELLHAAGLDPAAFGDLLAILENCPPHGGFGLGLDRLTMQLLGVESIADATAFPNGFGA
ncbi:amino acid--tRNA ligase-related protein [Nocardia sp. NPDC047038]|uniref:amino acid--tRNA ligase-related protein n=1 Tax=Nocardia sp. NPDC047038 TaxID=3154338 RepID=UPI0033EC108B